MELLEILLLDVELEYWEELESLDLELLDLEYLRSNFPQRG